MLVLDTNVYIDAFADAAVATAVADLFEARSEEVGLSTVVLAELLIGVAPSDRARLLRHVAGTVSTSVLITPSHDDWIVAADGLRALGGDGVTKGRSFWNDLLIAASCARTGAVLMTRNVDDFERIARVVQVRVVARP